MVQSRSGATDWARAQQGRGCPGVVDVLQDPPISFDFDSPNFAFGRGGLADDSELDSGRPMLACSTAALAVDQGRREPFAVAFLAGLKAEPVGIAWHPAGVARGAQQMNPALAARNAHQVARVQDLGGVATGSLARQTRQFASAVKRYSPCSPSAERRLTRLLPRRTDGLDRHRLARRPPTA